MSVEQIKRQLENAASEMPAHLVKNLKADLKAAIEAEEKADKAEPSEVVQVRAQLAALTADHVATGATDVRKAPLAKAIAATQAELAALLKP